MNSKSTSEAREKDAKLLIEELMFRSQFAKSKICEDNPMWDNPPLLVLAIESNGDNPAHDSALEFQTDSGMSKPYQMALIPLVTHEDVGEALGEVVSAMPPIQFDFMFLVCEGYGRFAGVEKSEMSDYRRGSMEEEFRNNPFTDIREAHVITGLNWEGDRLWNGISTYVYDDKGVPVFDEIQSDAADFGEDDDFGRMPGILRGICQFMNLATKMDGLATLMANAPKRDERKKGE